MFPFKIPSSFLWSDFPLATTERSQADLAVLFGPHICGVTQISPTNTQGC